VDRRRSRVCSISSIIAKSAFGSADRSCRQRRLPDLPRTGGTDVTPWRNRQKNHQRQERDE